MCHINALMGERPLRANAQVRVLAELFIRIDPCRDGTIIAAPCHKFLQVGYDLRRREMPDFPAYNGK